MRVVWRSLFWVGDGGWSRDLYDEPGDGDTQAAPRQSLDVEKIRSAIESARAANTSVSLPLPSLFMPFSQTLNMSAGEPTVWTLMKRFFFGFTFPLSDVASPSGRNSTTLNATVDALGPRNPSLLSDISFFNWFPSQAANRFLIDVLEGQIITLLVVVAFILIFLIREWVVQQVPVINMVALGDDAGVGRVHDDAGHEDDLHDEHEDAVDHDDDDAENAADEENGREADRRNHHQHQDFHARSKRLAVFQMLQESEDISEELRSALQDGSTEDLTNVIDRMPLEESIRLKEKLMDIARRIEEGNSGLATDPVQHMENAQVQRMMQDARSQSSGSNGPHFPERSSSLPHHPEYTPEMNELEPPSPRQRPNMPARDRSFIATEIRRSMEEGESWSFANVPQASGEHSQQQQDVQHVPESWEEDEPEPAHSDKSNENPESDHAPDSERSSESWQQVPDIVVENEASSSSDSEASEDQDNRRASEGEIYAPAPTQDTPPSTEPIENSGSRREGSSVAPPPPDDEQPVPELFPDPDEMDFEEHMPVVDVPQPVRQEPGPQRPIEWILDWLFGDVVPGLQAAEDDGNDEHIVQDLADEAPFVPFAANEPQPAPNAPFQDPEVAEQAARAGIDLNDQDAIDDAEDLEGIMELIGMQGPLTGLFQNAMFCAVLISATLACAVWFPYLSGKVVLLFVGHPWSLFIKLPLQIIAALADLIVDATIFIVSGAIYLEMQFTRWVINFVTMGKLSSGFDRPFNFITELVWPWTENAMGRIGHLVSDTAMFPHPDYFRLSINSHVALRSIQNATSLAMNETSNAIVTLFGDVNTESPPQAAFSIVRQLVIALQEALTFVYGQLSSFTSQLWNSNSYKVTLNWDLAQDASSTYAAMEPWSATDRLIAIFAGYAFFAIAGAFYLKHGSPISSSQQGRKIEGIIAEVLQQAGGVLKVILIISIEMLVFPLYCGLLLDIALLPLFKDASLYTRMQFACESPWTSGFVHWFIGTCYMFHFALFVSMCRKIMRKGVLYFIRDPDDPTFHPVRDVLERSVTTQLRKIAFSALVYGGLVIVCLGGVVWSLNRATTGVLPIHWTSQAPSLEFPLDLLFYNFLTPFIIKFYKPSDGLQAVYQWWFKACARALRLSNFLFGEKNKNEEGHHIHHTWTSWLTGQTANHEEEETTEEQEQAEEEEEEEQAEVDFIPDGKYVRAPASDQVRIPKGQRVFVEVDENNTRKDGMEDAPGVHNNTEMVTVVYIPPWFRVRIALFVLTIWIFAATTGVGVTVLPLLFGRYLFSLFLPSTVEMNDIHAFSLGLYTLGALAYSTYHLYKVLSTLRNHTPTPLATAITVLSTSTKFSLKILKFLYVWASLVFVIPFLFAMLLELYLLMPLHAYLGPSEPHVVHVIQDWTLGFLYARLAARVLLSSRTSRPARAFRQITRDGYLNPNARLATRCFLLPVVVLFAVAVGVPSLLAWTFNRTIWMQSDSATKAQVWRFSFPTLGAFLLTMWMGSEGAAMVNRWRLVVRDEVYLIGERLHNFGDKRAPAPPPARSASGGTRVEA
jgi:E3 ubiquitin-protein ligase MARCH6